MPCHSPKHTRASGPDNARCEFAQNTDHGDCLGALISQFGSSFLKASTPAIVTLVSRTLSRFKLFSDFKCFRSVSVRGVFSICSSVSFVSFPISGGSAVSWLPSRYNQIRFVSCPISGGSVVNWFPPSPR